MSAVTKTTGQLIPGDVNTPLDARTRVATLNEVVNIQNPFIGCLFYCEDDGKLYVVRTLKAVTINGESVANGAIDTYEEFKRGSTPTIGDNGNWFIDGVDTGVNAKGEPGADGEIHNLRIEITEVNENGDIIISDDFFPVAVYTSNGNCYPVEKGSLTKTSSGWSISITPYLAYDNATEFSGVWYVYCAGGIKGDSCTVTAGTITFSGTTYQVVNSGTASAAVFDFIFPENMTSTAENISITDAGNYFESANVEGALQELAAELNGVNELLQEI